MGARAPSDSLLLRAAIKSRLVPRRLGTKRGALHLSFISSGFSHVNSFCRHLKINFHNFLNRAQDFFKKPSEQAFSTNLRSFSSEMGNWVPSS